LIRYRWLLGQIINGFHSLHKIPVLTVDSINIL
jgi:hypothetical protein